MSGEHGYGPYTGGCRCSVCRAAKAEYVREKRRAARALAVRFTDRLTPRTSRSGLGRYIAPGITHGTAGGYIDTGCRCWPCTDAMNVKSAAEKRRAAQRKILAASPSGETT